ncbi:MAG: hypothetical protein JW922_09960 [Paludibacteraceae bacterium]|nr:hypothetical protein [Paludibacteraceae bacterium]
MKKILQFIIIDFLLIVTLYFLNFFGSALDLVRLLGIAKSSIYVPFSLLVILAIIIFANIVLNEYLIKTSLKNVVVSAIVALLVTILLTLYLFSQTSLLWL